MDLDHPVEKSLPDQPRIAKNSSFIWQLCRDRKWIGRHFHSRDWGVLGYLVCAWHVLFLSRSRSAALDA